MTFFPWLRSITLLSAATLALVPYASAQDTAALVAGIAKLQSTDHSALMRAAAATCLLTPKDRKAVMARLTYAGWNVSGADDDQWVEADFNDLWVTMLGSNDDFSCDVSDDIPQSDALAIAKDLLITVGWSNWTVTPESGECYNLTHPQGLTIFISSGGNDPVCTLTPHSAIGIVTQGN